MQDVASVPLDELDIVGPATYAADGYPHAAWARLRREDPVHWVERGIDRPFWAITKHADLIWLSRQPKAFLNGPRLAVFPDFTNEPNANGDDPFARHLLNMDPPDHAAFRKVTAFRFTPRTVKRLLPSVESITKELLDEAAAGGETRDGDFVSLFAAKLPLIVLADLLGVPREDWDQMFRWTNRTIGSTDPEFQDTGEAGDAANEARNALFQYFWELAEKRRASPRDDLVSVIANAKIEGEHLPPLELLSYYFLLVVAGNETTRNALSGGLLALLENPAELEKLRANRALVDPAVEEIVRWTSPVIQFCRTATDDVELRGKKIRAGDNLCLFYPSANRDEEVFPDGDAFRVDRQPNPHLAFGIGEHFCLGANLARMELRVAFRHLVARLEHVELAGEVERLRSSFVGGIKRVPIRYRLSV
ncbi:MAG: cytochrome P450 [Deltaproteobacteria bacterium]|nr:cytochrome P450 [Deltaproteobacteria bacterium]